MLRFINFKLTRFEKKIYERRQATIGIFRTHLHGHVKACIYVSNTKYDILEKNQEKAFFLATSTLFLIVTLFPGNVSAVASMNSWSRGRKMTRSRENVFLNLFLLFLLLFINGGSKEMSVTRHRIEPRDSSRKQHKATIFIKL